MHARKEGVRGAWEGGIKRGSERRRNKLTLNTVSEAEATIMESVQSFACEPAV